MGINTITGANTIAGINTITGINTIAGVNTIKEISLDLYHRKIITVEAKQYDKFSRYLLVTCLDQGTFFRLPPASVFAFIRYRKADELSVFNQCVITNDGKILVELTEQMLAVPGNSIADLLIIGNDSESFDIEPPVIGEDGTIRTSGSILSTMKFCVNVIASPIENSELESSYEYDALNQLILKATTDYKFVIEQARAHAEAAKASAENAAASETNAANSEQSALKSAQNALNSAQNAFNSEQNAANSAQNAFNSQQSAANSAELASAKAEDAADSAAASNTSANTSAQKAEEAAASAANADTAFEAARQKAAEATASADTAGQKAKDAADSAVRAESFAHGETGIRTGEDTDNAKYFYEQIKAKLKNCSGLEILSSAQPPDQDDGDFWLQDYA